MFDLIGCISLLRATCHVCLRFRSGSAQIAEHWWTTKITLPTIFYDLTGCVLLFHRLRRLSFLHFSFFSSFQRLTRQLETFTLIGLGSGSKSIDHLPALTK